MSKTVSMHRLRSLLWLLLSGCSVVQADDALDANLVPAQGHVLFGAFTTMDEAQTRQRFEAFSRSAGKEPAIHMIFTDWSEDGSSNFPSEFAETSAAMGAVPMVTWEPWWNYSDTHYPLLEDIANGQHDAYISAFLDQAARFDKPWFLRFAHEMEGRRYPWTSAVDPRQTSTRYIAAFRRISQLAQRIAPQTRIVWSPNSGSALARRYYPGSDVVDWVGGSLYNFPDAPQDPAHIDKLKGFARMYRELDKPVMIAEMGCAEHYTVTRDTVATGAARLAGWMDLDMADKPACLNRIFDLVEKRFRDIRALVWFDLREPGEDNWHIDSSRRARDVVRKRIADPRYLGTPVSSDKASRQSSESVPLRHDSRRSKSQN